MAVFFVLLLVVLCVCSFFTGTQYKKKTISEEEQLREMALRLYGEAADQASLGLSYVEVQRTIDRADSFLDRANQVKAASGSSALPYPPDAPTVDTPRGYGVD